MGQKRIEDEALREEFAQLRADIENLVGTVGRLADGAASSLAAGARRTATAAGERAEGAFDAVLEESRRTIATADKTIQAHPYISLAAAAGFGWLLARLLAPRR